MDGPLFVVRFKTKGKESHWSGCAITGCSSWFGLLEQPAGFQGFTRTHSGIRCGVELRKRTRGQDHLRHQDIQTTTIYTRLTQQELSGIVGVFDRNGSRKGIRVPSPRD